MLFVMGPTMPISGALFNALKHSSKPVLCDDHIVVQKQNIFTGRCFDPLVTTFGEPKVFLIRDKPVI